MKLMLTVAAGIVGLASYSTASATPISSHSTSWQGSQQTLLMLVDQKQEGIVNERSTGNEPFMGPGASGGPKHSAPGATEKTIQQPKGTEKSESGQKGSAPSARAEGSRPGGQSGSSSGSGSSGGGGR